MSSFLVATKTWWLFSFYSTYETCIDRQLEETITKMIQLRIDVHSKVSLFTPVWPFVCLIQILLVCVFLSCYHNRLFRCSWCFRLLVYVQDSNFFFVSTTGGACNWAYTCIVLQLYLYNMWCVYLSIYFHCSPVCKSEFLSLFIRLYVAQLSIEWVFEPWNNL